MPERATDPDDAIERLLGYAADRCDAAHVERLDERLSLLRFGGRRVTYQHAEERSLARVRLVRDRREGWALIEGTGQAAARAAIDRLAASLAVLPASDPAPMPDPWSLAPRSRADCPSTTAAGPAEQRAALARLLVAVAEPRPLGGAISTRIVTACVANTAGLRLRETRTRAAMHIVAGDPGGSTFARVVDRCWDRLDPDALAARALGELGTAAPGELPQGPTRVLLGPQATATLAATLGHIGLAAGPDGQPQGPLRFTRPGADDGPAIATSISMTDDGGDPEGLPAAFDSAGWPRRRVALIASGRLVGLVHDARTAASAGAEPTGHTAPPGWRFGRGPSPSHLFVAPGSLGDDELVALVDDGVRVQRLDYVRVLQPRQGLVTGTSRDATRRIRRGRLAEPLPPFRFTVGLLDLFRSVGGVGSRREAGEAPFLDSIVAPAVVVDHLPIDAVARR